jgi:hypothetical protein
MPNETDTTVTDAAAKATAEAATAKATADATATDAEPKTYDAKYVQGIRDEAAKSRIALKEFQTATAVEKKAIAVALGLAPGETPDPAKLQAALTSRDAEVRQLRIEGKVRSAAGKHSADAESLLDSRSFVLALADLDPSAADFDKSLTDAITAAVEANPKLKVAQGATRGGVEIKGGQSVVGKTFSRAQLREMDPTDYAANQKDIDAAMRDGRITP